MAPRSFASQFDLRRLTADLESYVQGSLLYMYLENFVTYDEVEIYPGPHMNMVMGPNGTGKSSIVAAMAIGLGWHPTVLGRSKDVSEFIKYNTERAVVEMALRLEPEGETGGFDWSQLKMDGHPETGYLVIRRELVRGVSSDDARPNARRPAHSSEWRVNGTEVRHKDIQELVKWLNIQCDNLCQFLPQDRVSEFARMTSIELLMETEKAAADPAVVEKHLKLIDGRKSFRDSQGQLEASEKALDSLKKQSEVLETALERHRNYEEHMRMVQLCEKKRPWLEYNDAREAYLVKKDLKELAKKTLDLALVDVEPLRATEKELLVKMKGSEKSRQQTQSRLEKARKACEAPLEKIKTEINDQIHEKRGEFFRLRQRREKQKEGMNKVRQEIRQLEELSKEDIGDLNKEEVTLRTRSMELSRQIGEWDQENLALDNQEKKVRQDAEQHCKSLDVAQSELAAFDDVKQRRLNVLQRKNQHMYNAYNFLEQHRSEYPNIFGPVCLEMSSKDPSLAGTVENCIGLSILVSFVTDNEEESERFLERIERDHGWRASMIVVDPRASQHLINNRPQLHAELRSAGFEGMAWDYIEGPEIIKYALLEGAKVLQVPVAPRKITRPIDTINKQSLHGIRKLVTSDLRFEINTSKYSDDRSIRCTPLRGAEFLNATVDENKKKAVLDKIESIRVNQKGCEARLRAVLEKREPLRASIHKAQVEKATVDKKRKDINEKVKEHAVAKRKLDSSKAKLKDMAETLATLTEEPIKEALIALFKSRKERVLRAAEAFSAYKAVLADVIEAELEDSLVTAELQRIRSRIEEMESRQETLKEAFNQANLEFQRSKDQAKALLDKANRHPVDDDLKRLFADLPESLLELETRIAQEQAKADMLQGATGAGTHALENLARLRQQINELEGKIRESRELIGNHQAHMKGLYDAWYPNVKAMVDRINLNFRNFFAQLGCLGEVRLEEKGDAYDEWEIAILIKFRDEEPLQRLSAQRQSGGEKSVSTILYLLALQEQSKSPFRVVDEINQGMDAANERKIHSLIVQSATSAHNKSQYFLITPKLLTNLNYHENMHVLCVFNGEGMPEPSAWRALTKPAKHTSAAADTMVF